MVDEAPQVPQAPQLRQTDFLSKRYDGETTDHDQYSAHFLSFMDYLAHTLQNPADDAALQNVISIFKCSLQGQARLRIQGKTFDELDSLKTQFINRFNKNKSVYAHIREYDSITYQTGDSAERAAVAMSIPADATLDNLVTSAQNYLDLSVEDKPREIRFNIQETLEIATLKHELNALKIDLSTAKNNLNRPTDSPRRSRSVERHHAPRTNNSRRSPSPYRQTRHRFNNRTRYIVCHYCSKPGHVWRECRQRATELNQRPPQQNFQSVYTNRRQNSHFH
ncbi:uncharacterized protein LOC117107574 [Anneissia japonica]|uniref:uncharacterized protein LOC117107574 n=1 Tax=Anneissia japonica TaxID=1529436 RepID=UPI001425B9AF|nr:uncharacterized protein LOC117107574 [Anneissia japonica]